MSAYVRARKSISPPDCLPLGFVVFVRLFNGFFRRYVCLSVRSSERSCLRVPVHVCGRQAFIVELLLKSFAYMGGGLSSEQTRLPTSSHNAVASSVLRRLVSLVTRLIHLLSLRTPTLFHEPAA